MPVEVAPRDLGVTISDAKEFSIPGQIENITPRPPCTRPPNCRGCQRPPCRRGIGQETPLIKK